MSSLTTGQSYGGVGIRRPTFSELPSASSMLGKAFWNEAMFGHFMHPFRDQFPDDMALWWLKRYRMAYYKPNEVFLVAVDEEKHVITGLAKWTRNGTKEELKRFGWAAGWWDRRNILNFFASAYALVSSWIYPNRAALPERENILRDTAHFSKHHWAGNRTSHWYLDNLGVHPDYQHKGIGRALVMWGIDQARKEGVACSVVASFGKDKFYQSCGFDTFVGNATEGEGNPIAEVVGGNIWFRDFQNDSKRE